MKPWLSHILILLIALQSVMAVADIHPEHQVDNHQHADTAVPLHADSSETEQELSSGVDCQHCCHCQSAQTLYIPPALPGSEARINLVRPSSPIALTSQLFKPPRA